MSHINLCAPHHAQAIPLPCIRWRENTYLQDSCSDFSLQLVYNNPKPETTPKSADEKMKIEKNNVCNVVLQTLKRTMNRCTQSHFNLKMRHFCGVRGKRVHCQIGRSLATVILVWYKWRVGTDWERAWFGDGSQIQACVLGDWYTEHLAISFKVH